MIDMWLNIPNLYFSCSWENWDMEYSILRMNGSPRKQSSESIIQLDLSYIQHEDKSNSQWWQTQN